MSRILTHTGKSFDVLAPQVDMIDPRDISHALAHLCRWNGYTRVFYSVAQHSCMVADLVPPEFKLAALLHDATKAYIGDLPRPIKRAMPEYQRMEHVLWLRICQRFDLPLAVTTVLPDPIKHADQVALATEHRDLLPPDTAISDALSNIEPQVERIRPWSATEARLTFHQRLMDQLAIEHRRKAA
ncbi:hypothetical protein PF66_02391 [Pseudomonas asplenii]|uniref:Phosphohydrolase n=1 Tax=Pseudomonas asplenii TaxID=53407 RepID=A0A0N1J619_9PSED|nr:phosphohydrolase [Pseudomonas fuscovaginae]KPA91053.1 hypothetical protein PF66_02391 [Pseudomonas fuscovaginae]